VSLRFHTILALGALALILGIAVQTVEQSPRLRAALSQGAADIGVEHAEPLSMRLEYVMRNNAALVRIAHSGSGIVSISVPADWQRSEVSGAPLADFRNDDPSFGFVRWHFPPRTSMTFSVRQAPDHIVVHNPSRAALKLISAKVDLQDGSVQRDIFLIQDTAVEIW